MCAYNIQIARISSASAHETKKTNKNNKRPDDYKRYA